jgi:hypothetical protein
LVKKILFLAFLETAKGAIAAGCASATTQNNPAFVGSVQ